MNKVYILIFFGLAIIILQVLNIFIAGNHSNKVFFSNLLQVISGFYGFISIYLSTRKLKKSNSLEYSGWKYITIACFIWFIGATVFMISEVILAELPYPSYSDIFYTSFYIFIVIGLIKFPKPNLTESEKFSSFLDLSTMVISISVVIWNFIYYYLFEKLISNPNPGLIFSMIYTGLDTFLLFILCLIVITRIAYGINIGPYVVFIVGCLFLIMADFGQAIITTFSNFTSGSVADIGWVAFSIIIGWSGIYKFLIEEKLKDSNELQKNTDFKKSIGVISVTYLSLGIVVTALILGIDHNRHLNNPNSNYILIIGVIIVFILVLARQILSIKKNYTLNTQLQDAYKQLEESNLELKDLNLNISIESQKLLKLNDKLIVSETQLSIANDTKNKFFSIIAHDLKNPIGAFIQLVDLLNTHYQDMTQAEVMQIISALKDSSTYTYDLLNNLLNWSRSQTGRIEYSPLITNIYDVIEYVIKHLKSQYVSKNILIKNEINKDLLLDVDMNMVNTIFRNIISNSIKFTNNDGLITIKDKYENGFISIIISDNGVGMDSETLNNLFRIDVKNFSVGTNNEKGTGLGLIICKEFIDRHKGKILVDSTLNQGSSFTIQFPKKLN